MAQETKQRPVGRTRRDEKGERIVLNLGVKRAAEQSQCETIGDVGLGPTVCHRAEPSGGVKPEQSSGTRAYPLPNCTHERTGATSISRCDPDAKHVVGKDREFKEEQIRSA